MAKTAKRLYGPAHLTASAADTYTVPASTTAIIRHIHLFNRDTSARTVDLSVGADAAGVRLFDDLSIPANSAYDYWCYLVLAAAEKIQGLASTTNVVTITIEGDEITLG